jgi:hypothetical protein
MPKIPLGGREVDALSIRFKTIKEDWNEYDLEDGTTIKMKAVVSEIFRIDGEYDPEGNPVYSIKSSNIPVVNCPDNLKKKT